MKSPYCGIKNCTSDLPADRNWRVADKRATAVAISEELAPDLLCPECNGGECPWWDPSIVDLYSGLGFDEELTPFTTTTGDK